MREFQAFSILCKLAVCALIGTGCVFLSDKDDVVPLPPSLPAGLLQSNPPLRWEYTWLSGPNSVSRQESASTLALARDFPAVVIAQPVFDDSLSPWKAYPAGYIRATDHYVTKSISLLWEQGFAAQLLLELAEQGVNLTRINISRLAETIKERGGGNPWTIDKRKLIDDLSNGSLRYYSVRQSESVETFLSLPQGNWYGQYAYSPPIRFESGGQKVLLTEGLHQLIRKEDKLVAEIWIDHPHPATMMFFSRD